MTGADRSAELEQLIAEFEKSGLRELHVVHDGVEIYLSNNGIGIGLSPARAPAPAAPGAAAVAPAPVSSAAPAAAPPTASGAADWPKGSVVIRAPYLGTFYRAPKPGAPSYVEVGSVVTAESELCLVEVMKLFTTVRADSGGVVHAILAKDGTLVEADQPLFVIVAG